MITRVKTAQEIDAMRESGRMLATVLGLVKASAQAGMSTKDLADLAAKELKPLGGQPAFLGYFGFPDVLCTSLNDEVVHGIPSRDKLLKEGDVLGLDFGVLYRGMITDSAVSLIVGGTQDKKASNLVEYTHRSLMAGIDAATDGVHVGDIGYAVEQVLKPNNYGIIRDLVGHGVGHELHEEPNIPNHGPKGEGMVLRSGMTIAIEPMATLGTHKVFIDSDRWTVKTQDQSLAAHFEHTVLITDKGAEILTST